MVTARANGKMLPIASECGVENDFKRVLEHVAVGVVSGWSPLKQMERCHQ